MIRRVAAPLTALIALFIGGAWVYTHLVGALLFRAQSAPILPAGIVLALAVLAGAASFFSPCSLAITPAFLTYFVQTEEEANQGSDPGTRRLFSAALLIATGIIGVSVLAGAAVGLVGAVAYNLLIYLIPLVGLAFVALGVVILWGRQGVFARAARFLPGRSPWRAMLRGSTGGRPAELIAFGVAYGAASHSCTLPVVIGIVMLPIAAGSVWLAGTALLLYGAALAGLMLLMLALGQPALIALRRWIGPALSYVIGGLFLATGVYLFYYFARNYGLTFAF